jgi:hypothetical protein
MEVYEVWLYLSYLLPAASTSLLYDQKSKMKACAADIFPVGQSTLPGKKQTLTAIIGN